MNNAPLRVTVWGENLHEHRDATVQAHYPRGMHTTIAEGIREHLGERANVRTATFDQAAHGLPEEVLARTGANLLFHPGHENHPVYHQPEVRRVIANAVSWAAQPGLAPYPTLRAAVHSPLGWYAGTDG